MLEKTSEGVIKKCRACFKEVEAKAKKCHHCGTDLRSWFGRHKIITVILVFILLGMFSAAFDDSKTSKGTTNVNSQNSASEQSAPEDFKGQLNREIESVKAYDPAKFTQYKTGTTQLGLELGLFSAWATLVDKAQKSDDPEIKKLGEQLKQKVSQIQVKEFPLMRKAYGEEMGKAVWEENMDIRVYGSANENVDFVSAIFSNNKNIKQIHLSALELLQGLRFDRVNYKWIKSADEWQYFDIESPKDSEVLIIGQQ